MDIKLELVKTMLAGQVKQASADELAELYTNASKAVDAARSTRAEIALELLRIDAGVASPSTRLTQFTEIAEALEARGVGVMRTRVTPLRM